MQIKGCDLQDGDRIIYSSRYAGQVKGVVKLNGGTDGKIIFLSSPTLPDEDVAFLALERVTVIREVP
jgi:hypothetical protein